MPWQLLKILFKGLYLSLFLKIFAFGKIRKTGFFSVLSFFPVLATFPVQLYFAHFPVDKIWFGIWFWVVISSEWNVLGKQKYDLSKRGQKCFAFGNFFELDEIFLSKVIFHLVILTNYTSETDRNNYRGSVIRYRLFWPIVPYRGPLLVENSDPLYLKEGPFWENRKFWSIVNYRGLSLAKPKILTRCTL